MERAAIVTLRNLIFGSPRLGQGVFRRNRDVSVDGLSRSMRAKKRFVNSEKSFAFRYPELQPRS